MNNAIINFLFNSQGAMREIDNFKSNFTRTIEALHDSTIGKLGRVATTLGSVFSVSSFVDYTREISDLNREYSQLPVEKISQFANELKIFGADTAESTSILGSLQEEFNKFKLGDTGNVFTSSGLLQALGINADDFDDVFELLDLLYEKINNQNWTIEAKQTWIKKLGQGAEFTAYMTQSPESRAANREFAKLGATTQKSVDTYRKFQEIINRLEVSFRTLGNTLLNLGINNLLEKIADAMDSFFKQEPETQKWIVGLVTGLLFLKPLLGAVGGVFKTFGLAVTTIGSAAKVLLSFVSPMGLIALAVAGIGTNFLGMHDAIDVAIKSFGNFVDELKNSHPVLGTIAEQVYKLFSNLSHFYTLAENLGEAVANWRNGEGGLWENIKKAWNKVPEQVKAGENLNPEPVTLDEVKSKTATAAKYLTDKGMSGAQFISDFTGLNKKAEEAAESIKNIDFSPTINIDVSGNAGIKTREGAQEIAATVKEEVQKAFTKLTQQFSGA